MYDEVVVKVGEEGGLVCGNSALVDVHVVAVGVR